MNPRISEVRQRIPSNQFSVSVLYEVATVRRAVDLLNGSTVLGYRATSAALADCAVDEYPPWKTPAGQWSREKPWDGMLANFIYTSEVTGFLIVCLLRVSKSQRTSSENAGSNKKYFVSTE